MNVVNPYLKYSFLGWTKSKPFWSLLQPIYKGLQSY
jgi:hypothetical protein